LVRGRSGVRKGSIFQAGSRPVDGRSIVTGLRWFCLTSAYAAAILAPLDTAGAQGLTQWTAVWATSLQAIPQPVGPQPPSVVPDIAGRTVRQIIYPSLGGDVVRLHVSNRYGTARLDILRTTLAKAGDGAALADSALPVTFDGRSEVHLPAGGEADSDPVKVNLVGHKPYAVSLYLGAHQRLQAWHRFARQVNFISEPGDHGEDTAADSYRQDFTAFAWITSLSVTDAPAGSVLAIGDSITDGVSSTLGRNRRWTDALSRRLAVEGKTPMAVLNAGIAGNRLLSDSPCFGESLDARFEREITDHAGVQSAVVLVGINDINFAASSPSSASDCAFPHRDVTAEDLIAGYRDLIETAHRHQIRVFIGTLTPAALPSDREGVRQAVNRWIRDGTGFDGVIDFDTALRDPVKPDDMRAVYDSGDHLHPSDVGYAAMAAAVPLSLLSAPVGPQLTAGQVVVPVAIQ
jgi:lysophospholipase L1-like esterase